MVFAAGPSTALASAAFPPVASTSRLPASTIIPSSPVSPVPSSSNGRATRSKRDHATAFVNDLYSSSETAPTSLEQLDEEDSELENSELRDFDDLELHEDDSDYEYEYDALEEDEKKEMQEEDKPSEVSQVRGRCQIRH